MALRGKMQAYAEARANGLDPQNAARHAGYEEAGIAVTVSRMERRADMQQEIARLRRNDGSVENQSGDERPEKWSLKKHYQSPLELFLDVMNNPDAPKAVRFSAAKDALPYCHARKEGGKKEDAKEKAGKAAKGGRFQPGRRPSHLSVVN